MSGFPHVARLRAGLNVVSIKLCKVMICKIYSRRFLSDCGARYASIICLNEMAKNEY